MAVDLLPPVPQRPRRQARAHHRRGRRVASLQHTHRQLHLGFLRTKQKPRQHARAPTCVDTFLGCGVRAAAALGRGGGEVEAGEFAELESWGVVGG